MTQLQYFVALLNLNIKAGNFFFRCIYTKFIISLIKVLVKHTYLLGYKRYGKGSNYIQVYFRLNFTQSRPIMISCKQVSSSTRPCYIKSAQNLRETSSLWLLSTTRGILTSREAWVSQVGGVLLCKIV